MYELRDGLTQSYLEVITLDCSGYIDGSVYNLTDTEIDKLYQNYSIDQKAKWEYRYPLRKFFLKDGTFIEFSLIEFKKIVLAYGKAIKYAVEAYNDAVKNGGNEANITNIEVLINDTTPTSFQAHFLFASEIIGAGVNITSMVLKFSNGKAIDSMVNNRQLDEEINTHSKIAAFFGYKIKVFSDNSDN